MRESVGARHAAIAAQPRHPGPAAALPRLLVAGAVQGTFPGALASCKRGERAAGAAGTEPAAATASHQANSFVSLTFGTIKADKNLGYKYHTRSFFLVKTSPSIEITIEAAMFITIIPTHLCLFAGEEEK